MFRIGLVGLTALCCCAGGPTPVSAQSPARPILEDESTVRFRTRDVLPSAVLTGPHYELEPECELRDGRIVFRMKTRWGVLVAHGRPMLVVRLREMHAIDRALKMNREPQLIGSFLNTLVDSRKGATMLLTDPLGSVLQLPKGIERKVDELLYRQNRAAGGTVRRRVAASLDCDPETSNPILSALLDWIAVRQGAGGLTGKVGLGLVLPGLSLIPTTAQFRDQLAQATPAEINKQISAELIELDFAAETVQKFTRRSAYTTLERLVVLDQLRSLAGVPQRDALLRRAAAAGNPSEAMSVLRELVLLNDLHRSSSITSVTDLDWLIVRQRQGHTVVVLADDYLILDRRLQEFTTAFGRSATGPALVFPGTVGLSPRARHAMEAIRISTAPSSKNR